MNPRLLACLSLILLGAASLAPAAESAQRFAAKTPKKAAAPRPLPPAPAGVIIEKDVTYLSPERQEKLDLYLPANRPPGVRSPAVVIIHGGGWSGGGKTAAREFQTGSTLAQAGYVCVSVEYMKEPGKRWPTNLFDCKNAVRFLRHNAAKYQVDADHIGTIGGSAGGHLALMVGYTASVPELAPPAPYPGISDKVQACVDMYGITDLLTRQGTDPQGNPNGQLGTAGLFPEKRGENLDKWRLASPVYHISKDTPPTLILHGTADTTVDRAQATELAEKLKAAGLEHTLMLIPCAHHTFLLQEKNRDLRPVVIAFFDKYLKTPGK